MQHQKKIHTIGSVLVALMLVGAFASALGRRVDIFKGASSLKGAALQTSLLTTQVDVPAVNTVPEPNFAEIKRETAARVVALSTTESNHAAAAPFVIVREQTVVTQPAVAEKKPAPEFTIVATEEEPEHKNVPRFTIVDQPAPVASPDSLLIQSEAEPLVISKPVAVPSCESQGKFTYTGPDRPGLLYGMCISCSTQQYILGNGKCVR